MPAPLGEYAETFQVYRHDGDPRGYLKPAALLRYAQQVAMQNAWALGLTDEVYAVTHTAYLLAKLAVRFARVPRVDETLTLLTQPEAVHHAVNKRITRVLDANGEQAALIDGRWVLIDTRKRMILRQHPPQFAGVWPEHVPDELPMKMQKAPLDQCEALGQRQAVWSVCDINGHLNNTRYVDMMFDALPLPVLQNAQPRELLVFYHKEVPLGQGFALYRKQMSPDSWYFAGEREGRACFEASLTLAADPGPELK